MGQQRGQYLKTTEGQWVPFTLTAGNNTIVNGVAGYQVHVYLVIWSASSSVNLTFKDGAGNAFTGAMPTTAGALDISPLPFICSTGQSFVINSSGNAAGGAFVQVF